MDTWQESVEIKLNTSKTTKQVDGLAQKTKVKNKPRMCRGKGTQDKDKSKPEKPKNKNTQTKELQNTTAKMGSMDFTKWNVLDESRDTQTSQQ